MFLGEYFLSKRKNSPELGAMSPVIKLNKVVFPAPLGPIRPVIFPLIAVIDTSLIATTPPKCFLAFFTERIFLLLCIFYFFGNRPMGLNNIIATNEVPNKSIRKASVGTTSDPKKNSWSCLAVSLRISGIAYNRTAPIMTP